MKTETIYSILNNNTLIDTILSDITNLQLVIFGVVVTIFTVLYSFIINKRDELRAYSELISNGKANAADYKKSKFGTLYITKLKKINFHLINLILFSVIVYCLSYLTKNFISNTDLKPILFSLSSVASLIVIIYVALILFKVIRYYNKSTKI